jgi:hypothetical protein
MDAGGGTDGVLEVGRGEDLGVGVGVGVGGGGGAVLEDAWVG